MFTLPVLSSQTWLPDFGSDLAKMDTWWHIFKNVDLRFAFLCLVCLLIAINAIKFLIEIES